MGSRRRKVGSIRGASAPPCRRGVIINLRGRRVRKSRWDTILKGRSTSQRVRSPASNLPRRKRKAVTPSPITGVASISIVAARSKLGKTGAGGRRVRIKTPHPKLRPNFKIRPGGRVSIAKPRQEQVPSMAGAIDGAGATCSEPDPKADVV
jgi:hypothetical protein